MTNFLDTIFNPWLGQVFHLPPFWAILAISVFITLLVTIVYKYTTNQAEMKRIKTDLKKYQKEMRETKDTKKLMQIQKKALDLNMKYMGSSFKSTLYTFIPIIILFAYLNMHIAYYPIMPGQNFSVTTQFAKGASGNVTISSIPNITIFSPTMQPIVNDSVTWMLNGDAGTYTLAFDYNTEHYSKNVLITTEKSYENPIQPVQNSKMTQIIVGNEAVHPFGESFNIFGYYPGWFATYIVLSLLCSALFRKLLDVY